MSDKITGPLKFTLGSLDRDKATFLYSDNSRESIGPMTLSINRGTWNWTKPTELTVTIDGWFK